MLVLTRKLGEEIVIDESITVRINQVDASKVQLGIEAPNDIPIRRSELPRKTVTRQKEHTSHAS